MAVLSAASSGLLGGRNRNVQDARLTIGTGRPADFSNTATGTFTSGGVNFKWVRFTANGTLTVTRSGIADVLIVSGGASGGGEYNVAGAGGGITHGSVFLSSGTHDVVIGAGGCCGGATGTGNGGNPGGDSRLGTFLAARQTNFGNFGFNAPLTSSITNTSVTYGARGGAAANTGSGGTNAGCCGAPPGQDGAAGVVIVRVVV